MELAAVAQLAEELFQQWGIAEKWTFGFDRAKRRAGCCHYTKHKITVSRELVRLYNREQVRDILLHEIAHAKVGNRAGHGPRWREMVGRIGGSPNRLVKADRPQLAGPWVGTCPAGHKIDRWKAPGRVQSCAICAPTFHLDNQFTWTYAGKPPGAPGTPKLPASYRRQLQQLAK